jgi:UDP-glucuronate 4-epimerase
MIILVTGSAGFIGFHSAKKLLENGHSVIGIDNFSDYYDVSLKEARNKILETFPLFTLYRADISDGDSIKNIFQKHSIDKVCHFAAQVGVRDSTKNKDLCLKSNITGFNVLIEESQRVGVQTFLYASSSSVYGENPAELFQEDDNLSSPCLSFYAETKRANEYTAHCYNHVGKMRSTGMRFFTVYGPWGRPDMALFSFTQKIINGEEIEIFGDGSMMRDFTYIDDVVSAVVTILDTNPDCEILNIGRGEPVALVECINLIESHTGVHAKKINKPVPKEDISKTHADITRARNIIQFDPKISLNEGLKNFIDWYKTYNNL